MGGLAFAELSTPSGEPPHVPRMPPRLYMTIAAECQSILETLFERVVIPRDAPAKKDYGDIDFLAGGMKITVSSRAEIWQAIKDSLGAILHVNRGDSHSFGIPHPELPNAYVQVDVELSPRDDTPDAPELFEWTHFMKSDSDLVQILGISHRPLGLTCNDGGLHVRVEQIEPYNKKRALIFLTRDPNAVMEFYGLDAVHYWKGFTDENDLFDWATKSRFFSSKIFEDRVEKSNDRSRQAKRPMYRRFVEEYMPKHLSTGSREWTRDEVLQEALMWFSRHREYEAMMGDHRLKEAEEQLWNEIRTTILVGTHSKSIVVKALKRWVYFRDGQPYITSQAIIEGQTPWTTCIPTGAKDSVLEWVQSHWQEVEELECARATAAKEAAKMVEQNVVAGS